MQGYYFGKRELKDGRRKQMIIMDIKVDNLYAFQNFHMNMSYPKRIVNSTVAGEYLDGYSNFRYKKVNVIMGGNATGKTSLGKLLMRFANYFKDGNYYRFLKIIGDTKKAAVLTIDFVAGENEFFRFDMRIGPKEKGDYREEDISIRIYGTCINKKDNYELCAKKMDISDCYEVDYRDIDTQGWYFTYPEDTYVNKTYLSIEDDENYLYILEQILKTLDPAIQEVVKVKELDNTYAVKLNNSSVIIKEGKITDIDMLSSGTKAGLDISYIIASLLCDKHDLYYCDELFSFVNSDVEKACLSIIIDKLTERKQLFFTTHNTDILDMQLPKHAFTFLKKDTDDIDMPIKCVNAADYLKRNTDSLKHAVENDLFNTVPDLDRLYEIAQL